jgi:hypothetical protein
MSRGPGLWQRQILSALERYPAFYLMDLLPEEHTRSQVVALNRAARQLASAYKIGMIRWMGKVGYSGFITVVRPGYPSPNRKDVPRINVASVTREHPCNIYDDPRTITADYREVS